LVVAPDPNFVAILEMECKAFEMPVRNVMLCVTALYHELSKHAHGNLDNLVIKYKEHSPLEVVALVAVFKYLKNEGVLATSVALVKVT
jgi:hypothetical protein